MKKMTDVQQKLFSLQDLKYKEFHSKLMPETNPKTIIGVRIPLIRSLIRELSDREKSDFLNSPLPHSFYEENNLHGFLISQINDFDKCIKELNRFLPFVDNWATCDSLRPVCFKKNKQKLLKEIEKWILSKDTYTVRFAIEMLMVHFLDDDFRVEYLDWVSNTDSDEYYVKMMVAWYFATALAKQHYSTLPFIEKHRLPIWTHKKTIQKAVESNRLTKEQKDYLRKL